MDKVQKFGRNSRRFFKRLINREAENVEDLNLSFTTHIRKEERIITWNIENFDRCPLKCGEYHQSPLFCTGFSGTTKWALRLYPKGKSAVGKIGLFIYKESSSTNVAVEFHLHMEVPDVEHFISVIEKKNIRMDSTEYGQDVNPPCTNFVRQKSVKIICSLTVGYLDEAADDDNCSAGSLTLCTLSTDLKQIYSSGKFSDVTFQVGKKHFNVHKAILAARSNVFAAMFDHPMEESQTNVVSIEDVEPSVFSDVLHYIYTGEVDNLTVDKAVALFTVADKYCLEELRKRCVREMLAKLCVENTCRIAVLADMHSEPKLKAAANHMFRKYKHQIFQRKEWETMIRENPHLASEILHTVTFDFNTKCSKTCAPNK